MQKQEIVELIQRELPRIIQSEPALQAMVLDLARNAFASKQQTEDRIERLYAQLVQMREESERKWEEQNRKWEEQNRKWYEAQAENKRAWEAQNRKWDKQEQKWDEQEQKWNEHRREFDRMHREIMAIAQRHERSIGALGSRWGLQTENAFRNALAAILEKSFGVEVMNVNEYDDSGMVFGRPEQVELDVIIQNGLLIIAEIKSSIDKAGMYIFERKVRFYEQKHQREAQRMMVISPMVDPKALPVAEKLGIEVYSDSTDVKAL